jgi:hypothetical protein
MNYDQLEEQFFILQQKNKDLEKQNNSLSFRNTELEATNITFENDITRLSNQLEYATNDLTDEKMKVINLKVQLDLSREKLERFEDTYRMETAGLSPAQKQQRRNEKDFKFSPNLPNFSVHNPMERYAVRDNTSTVLLQVSDTFGFAEEMDAQLFAKRFHVYAESGSRVLRYSNDTMYNLHREEDFDTVLDQMTSALKQSVQNEYRKSKSLRS